MDRLSLVVDSVHLCRCVDGIDEGIVTDLWRAPLSIYRIRGRSGFLAYSGHTVGDGADGSSGDVGLEVQAGNRGEGTTCVGVSVGKRKGSKSTNRASDRRL